MQTQVLVIAGTLAPKVSYRYYQNLIDATAIEVGPENVHFETISKLGLGDTQEAANIIGRKYLADSNDNWIIIGHSQGGNVASLAAIMYPQNVVAIIAIASPLAGTTWTDPVNMPVRVFVEIVDKLSKGRVKLRPKLRKIIAPIPVVKNLASHSDISEYILQFLQDQKSGFNTYCIIGLADLLVFPHRSAHPNGELVQNYLIAPESVFNVIKDRLPDNITHIYASAGHMSIINNPLVHQLIREIIAAHVQITQVV